MEKYGGIPRNVVRTWASEILVKPRPIIVEIERRQALFM